MSDGNKALLALAIVCGLPLGDVAKYPIASSASLYRWKKIFVALGYRGLMETTPRKNQRFKDQKLTSVIFKILHEPPELHGFELLATSELGPIERSMVVAAANHLNQADFV